MLRSSISNDSTVGKAAPQDLIGISLGFELHALSPDAEIASLQTC